MSAVSSLPCYVLASPAFWLTFDPTLWPWSMPSIFLMQFWTVCSGGGMVRSTRRCTTLHWTAAWMRNRWVKWQKRAFCTGTWDIGPPGPVWYWTAAWTRNRWVKWRKRAICTGTWDRRCMVLHWTAEWMRNMWVEWRKRSLYIGTWNIGPLGVVQFLSSKYCGGLGLGWGGVGGGS